MFLSKLTETFKNLLLLRNYNMNTAKTFEKDVIFLSPGREVIEVKGKLTYNEGDQAFTNMKIKKEFLLEFPHLREKNSNFDFVYLMKLHKSFKQLKKEIEDLERQEEAIPIVLLLGKERKEDE